MINNKIALSKYYKVKKNIKYYVDFWLNKYINQIKKSCQIKFI